MENHGEPQSTWNSEGSSTGNESSKKFRVVAAPDKFRGSSSASDVASAIATAVRRAGGICVEVPMADGGEGTLEAFGGPNMCSTVTGPLGPNVRAEWRLDEKIAVIEMAAASGIDLVSEDLRDPMIATTRGTGELIQAAIESGAKRVIVGLGGSATTDGGSGAVEVLAPYAPFDGQDGRIVIDVACDVECRFRDAARLFGPQKGATSEQVIQLEHRLEQLVVECAERFSIDVSNTRGGGAAGGLGGGLRHSAPN